MGAAAILIWTVINAPPAFADEFTVGIMVEPSESEPTDTSFMEGFQLAVDQSPDVSHPPGTEGGDHLGSIDVVIVVVDDATGPDELVAAAADLIERDGTAIIVADLSPDGLASVFPLVTESETMLIAVSDPGGAEFPATPFFFAAEQNRADVLLTDRTPGFVDAFVAAYGVSPSAAATRGYVAGRLVDIAVETTDRDPTDEQALNEGLLAAVGVSPTSSETSADQNDVKAPIDPIPEGSTPDDSAASALLPEPVESGSTAAARSGPMVVAGLALVAIVGVGLYAWPRRHRSTHR